MGETVMVMDVQSRRKGRPQQSLIDSIIDNLREEIVEDNVWQVGGARPG